MVALYWKSPRSDWSPARRRWCRRTGFTELGLDAVRVQAMGGSKPTGGPGTRTPFTKTELSPSTKRILELAVEEARRMGQHYISTEHLLLGLARQNEGPRPLTFYANLASVRSESAVKHAGG